MPEIGVNYVYLESDIPNAYAMGFNKKNSIILLTKGLLNKMSPKGIENLIYHELGHLKEKHLLVLYIVNIFSTAVMISILTPIIPYLEQFKLNFLFIGLTGGFLTMFFVILVPGLVQKYLEYRADSYATKILGPELYKETLLELNEITNNGLEKSSYNYPSLKQRLDNISRR
ncbi:MAG TPA: M48 family metalloprotease [Saprospiraceae bacterium]|nr:M48 family metalloprotease [Saprospiraceae bacterium]